LECWAEFTQGVICFRSIPVDNIFSFCANSRGDSSVSFGWVAPK